MDGFISLTCVIPEGGDDELAAVLAASSTLGAWLQPEGRGFVRAVIYLDPSAPARMEGLEHELESIGARDLTTRRVVARDWLSEYRRTAQPFAVGNRWWVDPRPDGAGAVPGGRIRLRIEPSTAFGSGSHESTQLVLEALEDVSVEGAAVLDLGSGSGILGLAAAALGADFVVGVDVDPQAAWAAHRGRQRQEWEGSLALVVGAVAAVARRRFDIVLCNILSHTLGPLLPDIHERLVAGGRAILAGMLESELAVMRDAAARGRLTICRERVMGEWAALEVVRD